MQIRATIWLFLLGLGAPAYALEHAGMNTSVYGWGGEAEPATYQRIFLGGHPNSWAQLANTPFTGLTLGTLTHSFFRHPDSSPLLAHTFQQRLLFATQNAYIRAGIGIQNIQFNRSDYGNGMRFSLGGHIGFGETLSLYGESAWLPGVIAPGEFDSASGIEFETGVMLKPLPFLSIKAAYRRYKLNYSLSDGSQDDATLQGIVIGTGIRW